MVRESALTQYFQIGINMLTNFRRGIFLFVGAALQSLVESVMAARLLEGIKFF
jgi:hypothetical protein